MAVGRLKVFLSSRFGEGRFLELRSSLKVAIEREFKRLKVEVVAIEEGDDPRTPLVASIEETETSHLFIHILGESYGTTPAGEDKSYTHLEYLKAKEKKIPIVPIVIGDIYLKEPIEFSDNPKFREWQEDVLYNNGIKNKKFPTDFDIEEVVENTLNNIGDLIGYKFKQVSKQIKIEKLINRPVNTDVFIGREGILEELHDKLMQKDRDGRNAIILITGNGGIGKTAIATRYYHKYEDEYSHLIWVYNTSKLEDTILSLGTKLGFYIDDKLSLQEQVEEVLNQLDSLDKPTLLVIDNVDDFDELERNKRALQKFPKIHILITTRVSEFRKFESKDIAKLPPDIAKELFLEYYEDYEESEEELLESVLEAINYNTLAIEMLAKNLNNLSYESDYSLKNLLNDLQNRGLFGIAQSDDIDTDWTKHHKLDIASPEEIITALYSLTNLNREEKELLSLFSVIPGLDIALNDLKEITKKENLNDILKKLRRNSWLDFDKKSKEYKINPIVAEIVREKNRTSLYQNAKKLIDEVTDVLDYEGSDGAGNFYQKATVYINYAEPILKYLKDNKEAYYDLSFIADRAGSFYKNYGSVIKALKYYEEYNRLKKELYKSNKENTNYKNGLAISYERLGGIYETLGDTNIALKYYEDEVKLFKSYMIATKRILTIKMVWLYLMRSLEESMKLLGIPT